MNIIESNQFNNFAEYNAIFFTKEGILVDHLTQSPFMGFLSTTKKLGIAIDAVYLDGPILIVLCNFFSNPHLQNQFGVYHTKSFLTTTKEDIQCQILRAAHWLTWNDSLQYCSKCGDKLIKVQNVIEKKCSFCEASFFPNLAPAIMVLIQKGNEILLARSAHFKSGMYSALAGFVDIGESAEFATHREVFEEVGIKISNLEYFGSQSWPFPNSFMIAFKAHYLSGDLNIDPNEIEDAQWFKLSNLPELPPLPSISRKLIDSFL